MPQRRASTRGCSRFPTFHRGALSLRFVRREWPVWLREELGALTSLAVRIECSEHPGIGSTEAMELASVERLREVVRLAGFARADRAGWATETLDHPVDTLERLRQRSKKHVKAAVRALAEVRGDGPCVLAPREGR